MKTLHVTFSFPPDPPAGTELYVKALCGQLKVRGVDAVIAAPAAHDGHYAFDNLQVRRFGISGSSPDLRELYAGADTHATASFERILEDEAPDVLHQHALTHACSIELMRAAKRRGLPVVFTYHTPTTTCQRGTLLRWGSRVCDGRLTARSCTACALHGFGLNKMMSRALARTPLNAGEWLTEHGPRGRLGTALGMSSLTRRRQQMLRSFLALPDQFVALAPWVRELLSINGVSEDRITTSEHGLVSAGVPRPTRFHVARPLRLAHLGRLDPVKGTELLIRAIKSIPDVAITLDIFGIVQSTGDVTRRNDLRALAAGDPRIQLLAPLDAAQVITRLAEYDLVAVPSQSLETGPLVVLEANAAGVPVVGSALGGIADKVIDGVNGILVSRFAAVTAWSDALKRCALDAELLPRLSRAVAQPRPMAAVAEEMRLVYDGLVQQTKPMKTRNRVLEPLTVRAER